MMTIDIKKSVEEIQESINKNKMLNVQIEQLDHEYDRNLEHILYLSDDIAKELKNKCKAIIDVDVKKSSIRLRMMEAVNFQSLKDVISDIGIDHKNITLYSVCDDEVLYIDMIISI